MLTERSSTAHSQTHSQRGQVVVLFALMVPLFLAISGVVIGIGNWYVHGKHLQTKADAGAIAGGGAFEFPCVPGIDAIDQRIADTARQYAGPVAAPPVASPSPGYNPQVGRVATANVHAVLNGPNWYDNDSNPAPSENLDICSGATPMRLEVKLTEDNSFPLASLIPLFPDIKRKATVELFQTDGMSGLLPIAVRAPEPLSALAIFYDEASGSILDREYLLEKTGPNGPGLPGLPAGLQGWSTEVAFLDPRGWASVTPLSPRTGVVIAISYRGACGTWGGTAPASPPPGLYVEPSGKCLEDGLGQGGQQIFADITGICNQGGNVQVANCYYATEPNNSQVPNDDIVQSGLHFVRGYSTLPAGQGPPQLHTAFLTSGACSTGYGSAYFAAFPNVCPAGLSGSMNIGSCHRVRQGGNLIGGCVAPAGNTEETRIAGNVEVKYTLVYGTGNNPNQNAICDFGPSCDLGNKTGGPGMMSFSDPLNVAQVPNRTRYAVSLRVRLQNTFVQGLPDCSRQNFGGNCEFYYHASGVPIPNNQPSNQTIFDNPVQRVFRGNSITAGSIRWLRLKADVNPCPATPSNETTLGDEGSIPLGVGASCFVVELGLKGGVAADVNDVGVLFNDGAGASQLGYLDCTESGPQSIIWELMNGCPPLYAPHSFNYDPVCPSANNLFTLPNPGPPWDADWRPLRCVKTRTTSQGNDLIRGLNGRFFYPNDPNPSPQPPNTCPSQVGTGYIQGRNYWRHDPTPGSPPFGYQDGSWRTHFAPNDARKVVIFLTTPESFTGSGQNTYPITGAIGVYITGYGTVSGNGTITPVDPCADPPPPDLDTSGGNVGGRVLWGHFINLTVLSAGATPSGASCDPSASSQPCVPVLVE